MIANLGFEPLILKIIKKNITNTPGKLKFPSRYAPPTHRLDKVDLILEENKENIKYFSNVESRHFDDNGTFYSSRGSDFIENAKLKDMKIEKLDLNPVNIFKENDDFIEVDGFINSTLRYNQKILNFQKVISTFRQELNRSELET